jgi:hypothetical protein
VEKRMTTFAMRNQSQNFSLNKLATTAPSLFEQKIGGFLHFSEIKI